MANAEHEPLFRSGVEPWNRWRSEHPNVTPDLSCVDFSRRTNTTLKFANLDDCDLHGADLDFAYLKGTCLRRANLQHAKCRNTTFSDADLTDARLDAALLSRANLFRATCTRAHFDAAVLDGASLVETELDRASFDGCLVYGISAWNLKGVPGSQRRLIITPKGQPVVEVDDIQVAQFVFLLIQHANLRKVINSVTERGVLLLGRFGGGGIEVLRAIAEHLRENDYIPIVFDFDTPRDLSFTETVQTLVGLSRFVVVDLSGPSVPQELYATVPHFKLPFVPILERGRRPHSMFVDLLEYPWVLKPIVEFSTTEELLRTLRERIIAPAEARVSHRQRLLAELFKE